MKIGLFLDLASSQCALSNKQGDDVTVMLEILLWLFLVQRAIPKSMTLRAYDPHVNSSTSSPASQGHSTLDTRNELNF